MVRDQWAGAPVFWRRVLRRTAAVAVLALVPSLMVAVEGAAAAAPTCQVIGVVPVAPNGSVIITLNCSDADGGRLISRPRTRSTVP